MKQFLFKALALAMALTLLLCCRVSVSAEAVTEARVPVTLTVINTERPISVTVPAALPVSVVDGMVLTADNAKIHNNAKSGAVRVTGIVVEDGALTVSDFNAFPGKDNTIALSINGCGTAGAGALKLQGLSFPDIAPGKSLPIHYEAKVAVSGTMREATAATVIFTIAAVD